MDVDDFPFGFRRGSRATFFDGYAIVGDVHLGFEEELGSSGYNVWEKTEEILGRILSLGVKKLIMLGDIRKGYTYIKPREAGVLIKFFSVISRSFNEVVITKGNHDGGMEKITSKFENILLEREFSHNGVGFMHGHALPSRKLAEEVDTLCISHLHPFVLMRDSNGISYRSDCFFFMRIKLPKKLYPDSKVKKGIVVPKFNPYIGGSADFEPKGLMRYAKIINRMTVNLEIF